MPSKNGAGRRRRTRSASAVSEDGEKPAKAAKVVPEDADAGEEAAAAGVSVTSTVVRAADLLPGTFGGLEDAAADVEVPLPANPELVAADVGMLMAFDARAVDQQVLTGKKKLAAQYLKDVAREGLQVLIDELAEVPREETEFGPMAQLPKPRLRLPRQLPVPKPKPPTKWELYAAQKGIQNTKRERMVYDPETKEYRPRWGYKSKSAEEPILMEVKEGDDPFADPWEMQRLEKKKRVLNNQMNHLNNLTRARKAAALGSSAGIAATSVESTLTGDKTSRQKAGKEPLEVKKAKLRKAQVSTASMGKFDARLPSEPAPEKNVKRKKVLREGNDEKARNLKLLSHITGGASDNVAVARVGAPASGYGGGRGGKGKGAGRGKGKRGGRGGRGGGRGGRGKR